MLREVLGVRMQDSVMKFGYACTFSGKPRGEPPAPPPEKRTSALPVCRALSRQMGKCIFRAMLAAFRTGRRQHLALGGHIRLQRTKHAMKLCIGPSLPRGARRLNCGGRIGAPHPQRACFCLLRGFGIRFGCLERRVASQRGQSRQHRILPPAAGIHTQAFRCSPALCRFSVPLLPGPLFVRVVPSGDTLSSTQAC